MNTFGFVCTTYYFYSQLTSKRFNYLTCWSVKRFNSSAIHDRQTERKQNSWRLDSVTRYLGGPIKARSGYRSPPPVFKRQSQFHLKTISKMFVFTFWSRPSFSWRTFSRYVSKSAWFPVPVSSATVPPRMFQFVRASCWVLGTSGSGGIVCRFRPRPSRIVCFAFQWWRRKGPNVVFASAGS